MTILNIEFPEPFPKPSELYNSDDRDMVRYPNNVNENIIEGLSQFENKFSQFRTTQSTALHLKNVFKIDDLYDTPKSFLPQLGERSWFWSAMICRCILKLLDSRIISYDMENHGIPFVNIVQMFGNGYDAKKSKAMLNGHTDAVSFLSPDELSKINDLNISIIGNDKQTTLFGNLGKKFINFPISPKYLILIGLKNPDGVKTKILPIEKIIEVLDSTMENELVEKKFTFSNQGSFTPDHQLTNASILNKIGNNYEIRFSHSNTAVTEGDNSILDNFKAKISNCHWEEIEIKHGDILILKNRECLHGRSEVTTNNHYNRDGRWLLRTYGLEQDIYDRFISHKLINFSF